MADPLSLSSGISGVAAFALSATKILDELISNVRDIPSSVKNFQAEVQTLNDDLAKVCVILNPESEFYKSLRKVNENDGSSGLQQLESDALIVDCCKHQLQIMHDRLKGDPEILRRNQWARIKKALKANSLRQSISDTRELCQRIINSVSVDHARISANTNVVVNTMQKNLVEHHQRIEQWQGEEEGKSILKWLSTGIGTTRAKCNDAWNMHEEGTGKWFLNLDKYMDWRNEPLDSHDSKLLWVHGIPGAGKSVMTSLVVEDLQKTFRNDVDVALAYIFCDYQTQSSQTTVHLLSSILVQLIDQSSAMPSCIKEAYAAHFNGAEELFSANECLDLLKEVVRGFRRCFVIVDAVDEYLHGQGLNPSDKNNMAMQLLQGLPAVTLYMSSRAPDPPPSDIAEVKHVQLRATTGDIRAYLEAKVQHYNFGLDLAGKPELRDHLIETLIRVADGQFLLPRLHMSLLAEQTSIRSLRGQIQALPSSLFEAYKSTLYRIEHLSNNKQILAKRILAWISCAARPIYVDELQHGLAVYPGDDIFDDEGLTEPADVFLQITSGLVSFVAHDGRKQIRFSHATIQDFFEKDGKEMIPNGHQDISISCISYLSLKNFANPTQVNDLHMRLGMFPFLDYATKHWGRHVTACHDIFPDVKAMALNLLKEGAMPLGCLQLLAIPILIDISPHRIHKIRFSPLHLAILCGLEAIVRDMILDSQIMNAAEGITRQTSLHVACQSGSKRMVEILLENDAQVNALTMTGKTALDMVLNAPLLRLNNSVRGITRFDNKIIMAGSPQDSETDLGPEIIHIGIDQLLSILEALDMPTIKSASQSYKRGLQTFVSQQDIEIVSLLLRRDIDVNSTQSNDTTPLQLAAMYGNTDLVRLMLRHGADAMLDKRMGQLPSDLARTFGHSEIAHILDAGQNSKHVCASGRSGRGHKPPVVVHNGGGTMNDPRPCGTYHWS